MAPGHALAGGGAAARPPRPGAASAAGGLRGGAPLRRSHAGRGDGAGRGGRGVRPAVPALSGAPDGACLLHKCLRRILADDLRWRQPERYTALRQRALAYYRERMRRAPAAEREWLL